MLPREDPHFLNCGAVQECFSLGRADEEITFLSKFEIKSDIPFRNDQPNLFGSSQSQARRFTVTLSRPEILIRDQCLWSRRNLSGSLFLIFIFSWHFIRFQIEKCQASLKLQGFRSRQKYFFIRHYFAFFKPKK